jgi:hypothetical protein
MIRNPLKVRSFRLAEIPHTLRRARARLAAEARIRLRIGQKTTAAG